MKAVLSGLAAFYVSTTAQAMNVGTYNIRYDNPADAKAGNGWEQRAPVIAGMIRFHGFDIVGTQEGYIHQIHDLEKLLPEYECTAHGRDDGKEAGENIAIFYRADKFKKLNEGLFWLSENPEQPGKGWDAALPRICGWAEFQDKESGKKFYYLSVHFDHRGVEARKQSANLLIQRIQRIAKNTPAILCGDFNVDQTSESYKVLHDSSILRDSYEVAPLRLALNGTANRFDVNSMTDSRIDHVFLTKEFDAKKYGILTDTYRTPAGDQTGERSGNFPGEVVFKNYEARLPSDHFPVLVEVDWK
nr:endonuclease/exonuclease/phosphatase family protein [Luteolibacter pohnpeiensis]